MNTDENQQGAYAKVNGLDLYYEMHGSGPPLVMLPGGFMTIEVMGELVRKLVLASAAFKRDGWYPEVLAGMDSISVTSFAGTRVHEAYLKTSPRPEAWPTFVAKMRQLLGEDYDWTEAVASLETPTLILVGEQTACASRTRWNALRCLPPLDSPYSRPRRTWAETHRIMVT